MSSCEAPGLLAGVRVVLTRAREQAGELREAFRAAGAEVAELPLLEIVPPADPAPLARAATELERFDWLVFSSANGVRALAEALSGPLPASLQIAVLGTATRRAVVAAFGRPADRIGTVATGEGLGLELAAWARPGARMLVPQAADASPELVRILGRSGFEPRAVVAYAKRLPAEAAERTQELFAATPLGWVSFASPSAVRHFVQVLGPGWPARRGELLAASIGPVTRRALENVGVAPAAEAAEPSAGALVAAVVAAQRSGPASSRP